METLSNIFNNIFHVRTLALLHAIGIFLDAKEMLLEYHIFKDKFSLPHEADFVATWLGNMYIANGVIFLLMVFLFDGRHFWIGILGSYVTMLLMAIFFYQQIAIKGAGGFGGTQHFFYASIGAMVIYAIFAAIHLWRGDFSNGSWLFFIKY